MIQDVVMDNNLTVNGTSLIEDNISTNTEPSYILRLTNPNASGAGGGNLLGRGVGLELEHFVSNNPPRFGSS